MSKVTSGAWDRNTVRNPRLTDTFFAAKYRSVCRILQNSCTPTSSLMQVSSKWAVVANEVILMTDMMTIMVMMVMIKSIYLKGSVDVNEVFLMTAHDSRGVLFPPDPK